VALAIVLPTVLGAGGPDRYTVAAGDPAGLRVARAAARIAPAFHARVKIAAHASVTVAGGAIDARKAPDDKLVGLLQQADRALAAPVRPPLALRFAQPRDPERDRKAAVAFIATMILYVQLLV
jgi:ABC-2 type transport system permease protein